MSERHQVRVGMPDNPPRVTLGKDDILAALNRLSELLGEAGVIGEVCLFGGAVMVLVFNARLSTRDVDAIFQPASLIRDLAARVGVEQDIPADWLNDGVKGFQSDAPELTQDAIPQFPHLRIFRPSANYLLAMKCMASRAADAGTAGDKADILALVRVLGLRTEGEVLAQVTRFFPAERILPKTQFMIHEVVAELRKE